MLANQQAFQLQISGEIPKKLSSPAFLEKKLLWIKEAKHSTINESQIVGKKFEYIKIGKTFGFQTTRYMVIYKKHLFYYNNQDDTEYKGFCSLENTYLQWFPLKTKRYLLLITNATEQTLFYFDHPDFWIQASRLIFKNIVQLDFRKKYQLLNELGQGSFSKVYLVKNKFNGQKYAAKIVSKKDKHKACTKSIVTEEKKILSMLNSEFVYKFQQFFEEEDYFIFVLEYLDGKDLMALFKEKREFSHKELIGIFRGILEGLNDCHEMNVIHRDLKPQNIIISMKTLKPKLIDFGLSLHVDANTDTKSYKRCGTMGYMAPQVIANNTEQRKPYTGKCDIFSFGIIAHMMLMGYNPLKGKNYQETYTKNKQCQILLKEDEVIDQYGDHCLVFICRLLSKHLKLRFTAMEALHSDFLSMKLQKDKEDSSSTIEEKRKQLAF